MRCACVDIGSNTTRLLVAEVRDGRVEAVAQARAFTRIGKGLEPGGLIGEEKLAEVVAVVAEQAAAARRAGAEALRVVATAAIRGAGNGPEFCRAVRDRTGVPVEILDGDEEARLAFVGATRTFGEPLPGSVAVVDVGGGSSELAVGTLADGVAWSTSVRIGSGRLADAHLRGDPPARTELEAVRARIAGLLDGLEPPGVDVAVAVGGSAASLRRLVGEVLDPAAFERAIGVLAGAPCAAVAERFDLDPERVRLLPAGLLVLDAAARLLRRPLRIGCGGLREGLCLELAGQ